MIDWEAFKNQLQSDPGKVLGFVISIAVCFLLIWVLVVVQAESPGESAISVKQGGRLDSLRLSLSDTSRASMPSSQQSGSIAKGSTKGQEQESLTGIFPILVVLIGAVALVWLWIKKRGNNQINRSGGNLINIVDTQQIPPNQHLQIISINGEYWVLGSGNNGINLLHRFSKEEWKAKENNLAAVSDSSADGVFASLLKKNQIIQQMGRNGDQ